MQTRSKILIAAAVAATLGAAGIAGSAYADRYNTWGGWRMGNMMGMHGNMMGRCDGERGHHMKAMGERIRNFADRYDTNKDGKVTQAEIDANRAEWFKKYDTNGDGKLSIDEYQNLWLAEQHRAMVRSFQKLDVDGTGAITESAYAEPFANVVEMLDQNNDGVLSRDDLNVWRQHHRDRWGMMQGKDQSRMPMMDNDDDDSAGKADQTQQ